MTKIDARAILYPNFRLANDALRKAAEGATGASASQTIGTLYTTPQAYVLSQWEIWGDGRRAIDDMERTLGIFSLLAKHGLEVSYGTAMQVSHLVKRAYTSLLHVEEGVMETLSETERSVVALALDYSSFLDKWGLAELTEVLDVVRPYVPFDSILIDERCILDEPYESFFGEGGSRVYSLGPSGDEEGARALENLSVFRAEGTSAIEGMVFDECKRALEEDGARSIAIVGKSPSQLFLSLYGALCSLGLKCTRIDSTPFVETAFGSFFMAVSRLLAMSGSHGLDRVVQAEASDWRSIATDVAMSPYASIAPFDAGCLSTRAENGPSGNVSARDLNAIWRSNRTLSVADAVSDLQKISPSFARIESMFSGNGDPFAAIQAFERVARAAFDEPFAAIEVQAVKGVISVMEMIARFQMPAFYVLLVAQQMAASDAQTVAPKEDGEKEGSRDAPEAAFISIGNAQNMPCGTFDETIFVDVSDGFLNAKSPIDATLRLAQKLGLAFSDKTMQKVRRSFFSTAESCKNRLVCVFPAHDANSQETFTSFCFDELIDDVSGQAVKSKDVVSAPLEEGDTGALKTRIAFQKRGEEAVQKGVGQMFELPDALEAEAPVERGSLGIEGLHEHMGSAADEGGKELPVISPSSIEGYLSCPYKWFINYMVSPDDIDEGFSPLERGTFAHEVLCEFYAAIKEGLGTVHFDEAQLPYVKEVYEKVASSVLRSQEGLDPGSGRYVAVSAIEKESQLKLIDQIFDSVMALNDLPLDYDLAAEEFAISPYSTDAEFIEYAGFFLNGKADRVDSSKEGDSFYVLDYKGSLKGHNAGSDCFEEVSIDGDEAFDPHHLPEHVQSIIYASALSKQGGFGASCKGAFYTSYRKKPKDRLLAGSYDSACAELAHLSNSKSAVHMPIAKFLDLVEGAIEARLAKMGDNVISPEPARPDACTYCIYENCARRQS